MVQGHGAAVSHEAVNELQFPGFHGDGGISFFQLLLIIFREFTDFPIDHVVLVEGDDPQPPSRRPKVFGEGIDEDGIVGTDAVKRDEIVCKGSVNIVGQDNQILPLGFYDFPDLFQNRVAAPHRGRIAGIDEEEGLDFGI